MAAKRSSPQQGDRRAAVEAAVLAAAAEMFDGGSSFAALSVDAVASRAGIGRTAFYFYFKDKRELLMRLAADAASDLWDEADRWWHSDGDGPDDLRASVNSVMDAYLRHATILRVAVEAATYDDEVRGFWQALIGRFVDATRERIESERSAGRAEGMPPYETAFSLVWMTERTLYQMARGTDANPNLVAEALTGVWERAIYGG